MNRRHKKKGRDWGWIGVATLAAAATAVGQAPGEPWRQYPMDAEVAALVPEPVVELDTELIALWLAALQRPEAGTRLEAAEAFAEYAAQGIPGLAEAVGGDLIERCRAEADGMVRLALARALVTLDVREAATLGWAVANDPGLLAATNPALARWGFAEAVPAWRARFADPDTSPGALVSAGEALATVGDEALPGLVAGVLNDPESSAGVRVSLADAVAASGMTSDALFDAGLARRDGGRIDRALAAMLMRCAPPGRGGQAVEACLALFADEDPTVVKSAFGSLDRLDPDAAGRVVGELSRRDDAELRRVAVEWIAAHPAHGGGVALLADRLGDRATRTRFAAGETLVQFADADQRAEVIDALGPGLAGDDWRTLEQAATVAGRLDHEPAADRLIELLTHDRSEVRVAAATALRRVAVDDTRDAMRAQARRWLDQTLARGDTPETPFPDGEPLAQLTLALGEFRDAEADGLFKSLAAKNMSVPLAARRAGVWALGQLQSEAGDAESVRLLTGRVNDRHPMEPEDTMLQAVAVLAIGRIGGADQAPALKGWHTDAMLGQEVRYAAAAALLDATGESLPPLPPPRSSREAWFLVPAN